MKRLRVIISVLFLPCGLLSAGDAPLIVNFSIRNLGADVGLGWCGLTQDPNLDTVFWLIAGGGYEWPAYFRTPVNELYSGGGGFNPSIDPYYTKVNGRLDLGIAQGILSNERLKSSLLEAFVFYKMRLDYSLDDPLKNELILASGRVDAAGIFPNSLLFGLSYADLDKTDPHQTRRGLYAEASVEWGPEFLFNTFFGSADFVRLDFSAKGFLPLFNIDPQAELNLLSGYIGAFFAVDWSAGDDIPINIQQTFGGRSPRLGLGYAVRGYENARFDAPLKAVLNLELRLNGPQFTLIDVFTPGLAVFLDAGYYNYLYYQESGFLCSMGAGIFLNFWKLTSFSLYTVLDLTKPRADGMYWVPLLFSFNAHF
jgi:hypothetical protein